MEKLNFNNKIFKILITYDEISEHTKTIAEQISKDYNEKDPLLLAILNGAFMYASDLVKHISFPVEVNFAKVSSYNGSKSSGTIKSQLPIPDNVKNRHVIIIEDMIDTGITAEYLINEIKSMGAKSVEIVAKFIKPESLIKNIPTKYNGIEVPNEFLIGYGLDYNQFGRNLTAVYKMIT